MDSSFKPENAAQVADVVAWAVSEDKPLEVIGHGSRRGIGRAAQYGATLDLSGLSGVTLYEPEELVLSARAGTPMDEIRKLIEGRNQELAFEPPDLSGLLGGSPDAGTIGGALACNFAGPRRLMQGAARDHFLGVKAVSGRGEMFKSGGRVVKNVTGYDLCKALAGSWGTLAVMTEVTLKVLPAAETEQTLLVLGADGSAAVKAMCAAMQSTCEVSGACHVPAGLAAASKVQPIAAAGRDVTGLRLEGIAPSVTYRAEKLQDILKPFGALELLDQGASRPFWREVRDVHHLSDGTERPVWRLSVPPAEGAATLRAIAGETGARGFLDWAGGLVWLDLPACADAGAKAIRDAVARTGGHATLIRADDAIRSTVEVFQPPSTGAAILSRRLKSGFDPDGILNAGRMYPSS